MHAVAAPQRRQDLPATLFKGRCPLPELQFTDGECDKSQMDAIRSIKYSVSAIQGPPGTGKTTTIAQLIANGIPQLTSLITCVQNKAIDPIAARLHRENVPFMVVRKTESMQWDPSALTRGHTLAYMSKRESTMQPHRLSYFQAIVVSVASSVRATMASTCYDTPENPPPSASRWETLNSILLRKTHEAFLFAARQAYGDALAEAESSIIKRTNVFLATADSAYLVHRLLRVKGINRAIEAIIIDEAGALPEWKMPILTLMAPEAMILFGDQQQLPPFTRMLGNATPTSALERIAKALPEGVQMLRIQYRMPREICELLSKRLYNGQLETSDQLQAHSSLPAICWIDHLNPELKDESSTSLYNDEEIELVCNLLETRKYLSPKELWKNAETVAVITFYSAQARRLRDELRDRHKAANVMTVDSAQGCEADYVIISCVRSNTWGAIGHVADTRRINVALSRAKKQVIVVGDSKTLVRPYAKWHMWHEVKDLADSLRPRSFFRMQGGNPDAVLVCRTPESCKKHGRACHFRCWKVLQTAVAE